MSAHVRNVTPSFVSPPIFPNGPRKRTPLGVVTTDHGLSERLVAEFHDRLTVARSWPAPAMVTTEVLLIDLAAVHGAGWPTLERLSRQPGCPSLILLDHHAVSRVMLARVAAEVLLPGAPDALLVIDAIHEQSRDNVFRVAAATIMSAGQVPHPLVRFLAAAFTERCSRVGLLADSYGFKQSTLRNQWRRFRSDPKLRLEDILNEVAELRAWSAAVERNDLRPALDSLIARTLRSCARPPTPVPNPKRFSSVSNAFPGCDHNITS